MEIFRESCVRVIFPILLVFFVTAAFADTKAISYNIDVDFGWPVSGQITTVVYFGDNENLNEAKYMESNFDEDEDITFDLDVPIGATDFAVDVYFLAWVTDANQSVVGIVPLTEISTRQQKAVRSYESAIRGFRPDDIVIQNHAGIPIKDQEILSSNKLSLRLSIIRELTRHQLVSSEDNRLRLFGLALSAVDEFQYYSESDIAGIVNLFPEFGGITPASGQEQFRQRYFQFLVKVASSINALRSIEVKGERVTLLDYSVDEMMGLIVDDNSSLWTECPSALANLMNDPKLSDRAERCMDVSTKVFENIANIVSQDPNVLTIFTFENAVAIVKYASDCAQEFYKQTGNISSVDLEAGTLHICRDIGIGKRFRTAIREFFEVYIDDWAHRGREFAQQVEGGTLAVGGDWRDAYYFLALNEASDQCN